MQITDQIERIQQNEEYLDVGNQQVAQLSAALSEFQAYQGEISRLMDYYSSEAWFVDQAADEAGELPPELSRGVLSEDAVYNLWGEYRSLAIEMLKLATSMLE